jgi:hypothetical protein
VDEQDAWRRKLTGRCLMWYLRRRVDDDVGVVRQDACGIVAETQIGFGGPHERRVLVDLAGAVWG